MVQSVLAVADNFENNYYLKMGYKREPLIKEITSNLAFLSKSTELKNIIGLIVFIIGKKPNYTTTFDTKNLFSLDIWDDSFLIKEIDKLDTKKLEEISNFLKESLQDYSSPAILTDECIKRCIQILKRDFGSTDTLKTTLNTQRDGDNFIEDIKNPANNLSWEFFKGNIRGHIQYNEDILSFLRDPYK